MLVLFIVILLSYGSFDIVLGDDIKLGFAGLNRRYGPPFRIYRLGSAMLIGLDAIRNDQNILENVSLSFELQDSGCNEKIALGAVVTLVQKHQVSAQLLLETMYFTEDGNPHYMLQIYSRVLVKSSQILDPFHRVASFSFVPFMCS